MSDKNDGEKQVDPRKEILFRQIGAKIAYYRTLRDMSQKYERQQFEQDRYNDARDV